MNWTKKNEDKNGCEARDVMQQKEQKKNIKYLPIIVIEMYECFVYAINRH